MRLPLTIETGNKASLQRQLIDQIQVLIINGYLCPGKKLPSTRELCEQLEISRNTVLIAYDHLISEGYLVTKLATGTFVSKNIPENIFKFDHYKQIKLKTSVHKASYNGLHFKNQVSGLYNPERTKLEYDFRLGRTDPKLFPVKSWSRLANLRMSSVARSISDYGDPAGLFELREVIADYLRSSRGISITTEQVIITCGCQQGLNILSHLFIQSESEVVVEAPCYRGARYVFEKYGAKLTAIPVDKQGIDIECFPKRNLKFIYVTPSHQYALGTTLSRQRRLDLVDWASRYNNFIVEHDYDGEFRYEGSHLPTLYALDSSERVVYMGSFSITMGAGLRLGYLVVPEQLIEPTRAIKSLLDNGTSWMEQAILADFIKQGSFSTHLKYIRQTYLNRRNSLISCLQKHFGKIEITGTEGGSHIAWYLPNSFPQAHELQNIMRSHSVGILSLKDSIVGEYAHLVDVDQTIPLGYGALDEIKINKGIDLFADVINNL